jgi:flagellar biosynthesis anti-sigma factor FlgM
MMRVDYGRVGVDLPEASPEQAKASRAGQNSAVDSASSTVSSADQTRLTFDQAKVQSLQAQVLAEPEIREGKVGALRQSISDGEYAVPASQIAEAIVGEVGGVGGED